MEGGEAKVRGIGYQHPRKTVPGNSNWAFLGTHFYSNRFRQQGYPPGGRPGRVLVCDPPPAPPPSPRVLKDSGAGSAPNKCP